MGDRFGTVRLEPHEDAGYSIWVLAQPTRDCNYTKAWVCIYSTAEGNRGMWISGAAFDLDPEPGWGVGSSVLLGAIPGTPAAN